MTVLHHSFQPLRSLNSANHPQRNSSPGDDTLFVPIVMFIYCTILADYKAVSSVLFIEEAVGQ